MRHTITTALVGSVVLALVAACGSGAIPSGSGAVPSGSGSPSTPAATSPATASSAPAPTAPPGQGGTDVQDPCALATVDEVSAALGVPVEAEALTGDTTTYCNYNAADGSTLLALSFSRGNAFVFDSYASGDGAVMVPGIGDGAVVTSQGVMFIKSGDAVVGVQPIEALDSPEDLIRMLTPVAQAIAARL